MNLLDAGQMMAKSLTSRLHNIESLTNQESTNTTTELKTNSEKERIVYARVSSAKQKTEDNLQ